MYRKSDFQSKTCFRATRGSQASLEQAQRPARREHAIRWHGGGLIDMRQDDFGQQKLLQLFGQP